MIKSIRTSDVYSFISLLPALTGICDVFSQKPVEEQTPTSSYLYLSIVSDNVDVSTLQGIGTKLARVQFNIFSKVTYTPLEDEESVLMDIIQVLDDSIAKEMCNKLHVAWNVTLQEVLSDSRSPIFYNEKNRPYIVKDYLFRYYA